MLMLGLGDQIRCFTWIEDIARAIAAYSFDPRTENEDFNLGNPEPVTMRELAQRIYTIYHELIGERPVVPLSFDHQPTFSDDVLVRIPDVAKAAAHLCWRAEVTLDEMLRRSLRHELERTPVAG
jgi:nucleoside-diphosphate-sugar epimerase